MAVDVPDVTVVSDIEARTGHSRSWVNKYRAALIKDQVVRAAGHGKLAFAVPHLGEYLKKQL
ncbi:Uncharacterised protein [Bifidobacterium catenulatum]|nr:Uncharacterised protein [Bifidobacterium catenulatum]